MENQINIEHTVTVEELKEIIENNEANEVAKAIYNLINKQTGDWYEQYDRANKAEKELAGLKATLFNWAIKQLNQ